MCLNPVIRENKKYKPTKKNRYGRDGIEIPDNNRKLFIIQKCGKCEECRRERGKMWQIRLKEEQKNTDLKGYFVTLTINNENYKKIKKEIEKKYEKKLKEIRSKEDLSKKNVKKEYKKIKNKIEDPNEVATYAVRHFCQRWQMKFKESCRHWFISELGHKNTERLHLHGIIWQNKENIEPTIKRYGFERGNDILSRIWKYGIVFTGNQCNNATINYITKYITKEDEKHKDFFGKVLTSPGLGKKYLTEERINLHKKIWENQKEIYYRNEKGYKQSLPIYYRNKIWNEKERGRIWSELLEKNLNKGFLNKEISLNEENGIEEYVKKIINKRKNKAYKDELKPFDAEAFKEKLKNMYVK